MSIEKFNTPEWQERIKELSEIAKKNETLTIQQLMFITAILGNAVSRVREDMHPHYFEISLGTELFKKMQEYKILHNYEYENPDLLKEGK